MMKNSENGYFITKGRFYFYCIILCGVGATSIIFTVLWFESESRWNGYKETVLNACIISMTNVFNEQGNQVPSTDEIEAMCEYQLGMLKK